MSLIRVRSTSGCAERPSSLLSPLDKNLWFSIWKLLLHHCSLHGHAIQRASCPPVVPKGWLGHVTQTEPIRLSSEMDSSTWPNDRKELGGNPFFPKANLSRCIIYYSIDMLNLFNHFFFLIEFRWPWSSEYLSPFYRWKNWDSEVKHLAQITQWHVVVLGFAPGILAPQSILLIREILNNAWLPGENHHTSNLKF